MDELTKISFLGLSQQDTVVIISMLKLWSTVSPLKYRIVDPDNRHEASLVFLDAENPEAMSAWEQLRRTNSLVTRIMVGNADPNQSGVCLPRPLLMHRVQEVLQRVTRRSQLIRHKTAYGIKAGQ